MDMGTDKGGIRINISSFVYFLLEIVKTIEQKKKELEERKAREHAEKMRRDKLEWQRRSGQRKNSLIIPVAERIVWKT